MNINDIATIIWNNDAADHLASHYMIRDENGNFNLAKITTTTGHFLVAEVDEAEDGTYITYSVYAPSDEDMADPITTDGFKTTTEEHAAACLADILAEYRQVESGPSKRIVVPVPGPAHPLEAFYSMMESRMKDKQ